jgi:hypothetical protein
MMTEPTVPTVISERFSAPEDAQLQDRFLAELNRHARPLDAIFDDLKITISDVGRWLRTRMFRRRLAELLRAARKLREVETERAGLAASIRYMLAVAGRGGMKGAQDRKACQDAIRNASMETRRRAGKIVKDFLTAQARSSRGPGGLAHPDVAHFAGRLVDELEAAHRSDEREARRNGPTD